MEYVALGISIIALVLALSYARTARKNAQRREIDLTDRAMKQQLAHYEIRMRAPEAKR